MPNTDITQYIRSGSKARLIPVAADSKKEERATSVLLSTFMIVPGLAEAILSDAGAKVGRRAEIKCYTEIVFDNKEPNNLRPDGLIVISSGKKTWSALVEAKVGTNALNQEQIENYLDLAKTMGANALITISNQFALIPTHHPVTVSKIKTRSVELFHFSWLLVLSKATILSNTNSVTDREQEIILKELVRYLDHPSSGVAPMTRMPPEWKDLCALIQQDAAIHKTSDEAVISITCWQQLFRYLAITLSMATNSKVEVALSRAQAKDPGVKLQDDISELLSTHSISGAMVIPNAASNILVVADFRRRTIAMSMRMPANKDRARPTAAINWLTRQLKSVDDENLLIKATWSGRTSATQGSLKAVIQDPATIVPEGMKDIPRHLEITRVLDLGPKFKGAKTFVEALLSAVPAYYSDVGQHLNKWVPNPPKAISSTNPTEENICSEAQKELSKPDN